MNATTPRSHKETLSQHEILLIGASTLDNLQATPATFVEAIYPEYPTDAEVLAKEDAEVELLQKVKQAVSIVVEPVSAKLLHACMSLHSSVDRPLRQLRDWVSRVEIKLTRDFENPPRRKGSTKPRQGTLSFGRSRKARYYQKRPLRLPLPC